MAEALVGTLNRSDGAANLGGTGKGEGHLSKGLKPAANAFGDPGDCGGVSRVDFPWTDSVDVLG